MNLVFNSNMHYYIMIISQMNFTEIGSIEYCLTHAQIRILLVTVTTCLKKMNYSSQTDATITHA